MKYKVENITVMITDTYEQLSKKAARTTPVVPASILQLHNDVTVIVDEKAAKEIKPYL